MKEQQQITGLTSKEVVEKVFEKLKEGRVLKEVTFTNEASTVIADDSDWHRTRRGYMFYQSLVFCGFNSHTVALGLGKAGGSYPAEPYSNDIIALEIPLESTEEELIEEIRRCSFLENSIVVGLSDGRIGTGSMVKEKLNFDDFPSFVAKQRETDDQYLSLSNLSPVVTQATLWKKELVDYFVEKITQILMEA